jgi:hypothetical protein
VTLSSNETAESKTYDGTTAATLSGGPLTGVVAGDSGGLSLVGTFASPNAGQHIPVSVALNGPDAGDYVLGATPNLQANIDPAQLVATANPVVTSLGGALPTLSGAFTGFVDGQTLASLEAAGYRADWSSAVSSASAAGYYAITGSFSDSNYSVVQAASNSTAFDATLSASSISNTSGSVLSTLASLSGANGSAATGVPTNGSGLVVGTSNASAGFEGGGSASADSSGTSASTGNGAGLSLGADSTFTSRDGTVTLANTAGGAGNTNGGASPSEEGIPGSADNPALGTKNESLSPFGGRRLIVVSGGVNSSLAH